MKVALFIGFLVTVGIYVMLDSTYSDLEGVVDTSGRMGYESNYMASNTKVDGVVAALKKGRNRLGNFGIVVWGSIKQAGKDTAGWCKKALGSDDEAEPNSPVDHPAES